VAAALPPPPAQLSLLPRQPLISPLLDVFGSAPPSQPYALAKALSDSGKLMTLDRLLARLKVDGHRVLVFCQVSQVAVSCY
jgi:DNA helicase INO80